MEYKLSVNGKKSNYIFCLLFLGLLFLRFPLLFLVSFRIIPIPSNLGLNIYYNGTYLITAMLIILRRNLLSNYNIDFSSLLVFLIAPVARILSEYLLKKAALTGTIPADPIKIAISLCLLILLLIFRPKLCKRSIKEIFIYIFATVVVDICFGILLGIISGLQVNRRMQVRANIYYFIASFIIQLSNAAVTEEPLFRGFLWGILKNMHWKDSWIWLFQTVLFMLGHIYYLGVYNYSFWITVPISALVLGMLVWRSRSIGTTMIAHSLFNSVGDVVAHFTW